MTYSPIYRLNLALLINFQLSFLPPITYQSICKKNQKKQWQGFLRTVFHIIVIISGKHTPKPESRYQSLICHCVGAEEVDRSNAVLVTCCVIHWHVTEFLKQLKTKYCLISFMKACLWPYQLHKWKFIKRQPTNGQHWLNEKLTMALFLTPKV